MEKQKKQILNGNLRVLLFKFSLPAVIGMVVAALYNFIDTLFVGNVIGPNAIAGLTIIIPVIILIISVGLLTGVGAASIISRSLGRGDKKSAQIAGADSIVLNFGLNIIIMVILYVFTDQILKFLGASSEVLPYAKDYLSIMLFGFMFFSFSINGNNLIRAEGRPRAAMYAMLIGAILNIMLDAFFIFVMKMGVQGVAIATVISQIASCTYIIIYFRSSSSIFHLKPGMFKINKSISREILGIGVPSFLMEAIWSVLFLLFIRVVRQYGGDIYIAITGIGIRILDMIFMPMLGINQGFSPIAGFNYGAKKYLRVKRILKEAFIWISGIGTTGFIVMVGFPQLLMNIFTNDPELIERGIIPLRLIASMAPLWAFPILGSTFFQAIGKARPALIITLSRDILFFIPAILILPIFFGLTGAWVAWPLTDFFSFLVSGVFLLREISIINRSIELQSA